MMPLRLALLLFTSLQMSNATADEMKLSAAYLVGHWSLAGSQGCQDKTSHYLRVRQNGTLEIGSGNGVWGTGFWELNREAIILHMLVAPTGGHPDHPFYQGNYHYQYRTVQVLGMRPDGFDASVGTSAGGDQYSLTRCK
jgi:hypothetical protein